MGFRLTLALSVYLLYSIRSFGCHVESDRVALRPQQRSATAERDSQADSPAAARTRRHAAQSRVSLIEPPSVQQKGVDAWASRRRQPSADGGPLVRGSEYDNQTEEESSSSASASSSSSPSSTSEAAAQGDDGAAASDGDHQIVSPLIVYLIVAGIILMMIALLVISVAILYIICTIPANDKDEDACAMPDGNASSSPRTSASFSRCPSLPPRADDRRYSEQSVDLVHKSRGSSLSRQSSCRICPRFAPKSARGRASCASAGTSSSGGSDDAAAVAATTAGKKDYFVACVCDLPAAEEYSPSASTTTTFGRC